MSRESRMPALLRILDETGPTSIAVLLQRTGWANKVLAKTVANARYACTVTYQNRDGLKLVALTAEGRNAASQLRKKAEPAPVPTPAPVQTPVAARRGPGAHATLAEQALALIERSHVGLDSAELADALGCRPDAVDAALRPHQDALRFVACGLRRRLDGQMVQLVLYRRSAAPRNAVAWRALQSIGLARATLGDQP